MTNNVQVQCSNKWGKTTSYVNEEQVEIYGQEENDGKLKRVMNTGPQQSSH